MVGLARRRFAALASLVLRYPVWVVAFWMVLAVGGLLAAVQLPGRLSHAESPPVGSDSYRAAALMARLFPEYSGVPHLLVVRHRGLIADSPSLEARMALTIAKIRALPAIRSTIPWPLTASTSASIVLAISDPRISGVSVVPQIRKAIRDAEIDTQRHPNPFPRPRGRVPEVLPSGAAHSPLDWAVTGPAAAAFDVFRLLGDRLGGIERISLALSLLALYYVFGGLLLVFLALSGGVVCLAILPALLLGESFWWPITSINPVVAAVVAMALGLDYPLLFLNRLREEFDGDLPMALARAMESAGPTIVVSTLVIGTAGLSVMAIPLSEVASIGLTMVGAAGLAAGTSLTLISALLVLLARRWDVSGQLARARRLEGDRRWERLARYVTARPVRMLVACGLLFVGLITPACSLRTWAPYVSMLPAGLESRRGLDYLLAMGHGGLISPIFLVWEAPSSGRITDLITLRHLDTVSVRLRQDPRISRVESLADFGGSPEAATALLRHPMVARAVPGVSVDRRFTLMRVIPRLAPDDPQAATLIADIRRNIRPLDRDKLAQPSAHIGGMQAELADSHAAFMSGLPWILAINVFGIGLLLGCYLQSAILPIKAVLTNLLPVLAGLGAVVAVFQWGWGAELLGEAPGQPIQSMTVAILFSLLYAISMDYELFMLARIREEYGSTGSHGTSVIRGLCRSGRVVLGAALVLLSVFAPYVFVEIRTLKELGVGLSVAVLLDATVVRLVLVPAVMVLMGDLNYWVPGQMRANKPGQTKEAQGS